MTERARNVLLLGADYGLFLVGLAFASQATILPAFAAWLGAPNVVIGAIPAVMTLGWFLPSLFAAGHTETLPAKLPFICGGRGGSGRRTSSWRCSRSSSPSARPPSRWPCCWRCCC